MSTYIEIVAAPSDTTTFGKDGLYANNREDVVRVEVENAADTNKIIIGPVVISWNGRLISTQVFVLPSVAQPPTSYWDDLPREFRIPIRVVVSGRADSVSAADTLYIVRPFANAREFTRQDPTIPNTFIIGEILENGSTPKSVRSRRGALVVGDVSLEGNGTGGATNRYNVSTLDCDPRTDGNQGYLPFVMLSTGKIDGGRAILSANASGKNGGAGGGGGGGQVCDALNGSGTTMSGGNGFTGGASGGNNASSSIFPNGWYNGGSGTGPKIPTNLSLDPAVFPSIGGSSLNGAGGATSRSLRNEGPQAAGGGTGHPFGLSGRAWNFVPNDRAPAETAGGGIGRDNGVSGDGGGYGTTGYSAASGGFAGGQRHGNEAVVPIAGGSGGASGNPRTFLACSGDGGGGGGAIRIAGNQVTNLILEARGASGLSGSPNGGAGSGGHISIHSREDVDNIFLNVSGGDSLRSRYLGAGRVRYDTPNRITQIRPIESRGITSSPADSLYRSYTGITLSKQIQTVASPYARPDTNLVNISGYGGAQGGIFLFRRSLRGRWERTESTNLGNPDGQGKNSKVNFFTLFTPRVAQPDVEQDSLLFVVSVQRAFFPEPIAKEVIPEWVMSQSGTTIFTVEALPLIEVTPQPLLFQQVERCGVADAQSTGAYLTIKNVRAGFLRIDSVRSLSPHFTIDTMLARPFFIPRKDSVRIPIRFTATSALPADSLFAISTLQIYHNDTIPDIGANGTFISRANPINIALRAPIKTIQFIVQPTGISLNNGNALIDFGKIAVGSSRDTLITIPNASRDAVQFVVSADKQPLSSTPFRFTERTFTSDSLQLRIRFQPDVAGAATTQTVIVRVSGVGRCTGDNTSFRFTLSGEGTRPELDTVNTTGKLSFGSIPPLCYPDIARTSATFTVASGGNDILSAQVRMANPASRFTLSPIALSLSPNTERQVQVQFTALATTRDTVYRDTLILTTNDPRPAAKERRVPFEVQVRSSFAQVNLVPSDMVRFGAVRFFNAVRRSVRITNSGTSPFTVTIGSLSAPYRIVYPAQSLLQLAGGAQDSVVIEVLPTDAQVPDVPLRGFLRLSYSNVTAPCSLKPDSVALLVTPTGPIAMQARIWLDTLRDVNMLRDTSIRLFGQVIGTAINRVDNFTAAFKIRRGMFYPRAEAIISPFGTVRLDTNRADSLDRFVVMTIPNVRLLSTTTLIATIGGTPIVTDTMRSAFEWVLAKTSWSRKDSVYDVSRYGNGLMVMNVVLQQIGNSLVPRLTNNAVQRRTMAIVSVYPTPARDELSISAQVPEEGVHSVQIVNMLGERLFMRDWKPEVQSNDLQNAPPSIITIPLTSLTSGVYGVVVVSPSGKRVSAMITIQK
ncbi:MAG: hypothetical protein H9535_16925 [Ignavibacteria bacterium]|nr:hypothetical protein [Ignavibacteria bacterium]